MTRDRDWEHLGRRFAVARKAAGMSQEEAADRIDVSRTTVQAIERGRQANGSPFTKVSSTMRAYARLVGWTDASPARILEGQEPEPATQPAAPEPAAPPSDLPPAVARELGTGQTLDYAVVDLSTDEDEDTRIIVVLKGGEDMTEEEIGEAWRKWRRTRRRLQAPPDNPDTPDTPQDG